MTLPYQPAATPVTPSLPAAGRRWQLPLAMIVLSLAALAGALWQPHHQEMWYFVPFTFLGNSLAPLPYDGAVIYLGAHYSVWLVVAVGTVATVVIEAWNMELLARGLASEKVRGFRNHRLTRWCLRMYGKAPFWSLVGTCILPIVPHYPMRILATLARYPMWKYQATVILGRGGRYAWLAAIGWAVPIPVSWIVIGSLVLLLFAVRGARKMNREGDAVAEPA